jgi:hypothetical protein
VFTPKTNGEHGSPLLFDNCFAILMLKFPKKYNIKATAKFPWLKLFVAIAVFVILIIFKHDYIFNPAFENLAQIINLSCADPLIFPQSVNCRTADVVLVDKSVGALITFLQSFPKGSVFYH